MLAVRAPLSLFLAFQLEGSCVQKRLLKRQDLLVFFDTSSARAQPVPVPLPAIVLVGSIWARGNVSRPSPTFAPLLLLFLAFQLEGVCVQQRFLKRHELLVLVHTNVARARPVPPPLPPGMLVGPVWA